jgi:Flp pilus assembly pilin Flp
MRSTIMTHLTNADALEDQLVARAQDEEGGLSVEWLALAAALVVILVAVGSGAGETIASAVGDAFESIAGRV